MGNKGFTLMEVMMAVVIVGILAAIAIPSYTGYITRTRRADAITALQSVALDEEKVRAENGWYTNNLAGQGYPDPSVDNYLVTINLGAGNLSYIATATGRNAQAGETIIFAIHSDGRVGKWESGAFVEDNNLWSSLRP